MSAKQNIEEMALKKIFTLVFLKKNNQVLMGYKTRGLGQGLWNGFGGKVERDESVLEAVQRELKEECNVSSNSLTQIGIVRYEVEKRKEIDIVHVFTSKEYTGEIKPSEEMNPLKWYPFNEIPFNKMWPDAKFWYPSMLKDNYFSVLVKYNTEGCIEEKYIKEFSCLENALNSVL